MKQTSLIAFTLLVFAGVTQAGAFTRAEYDAHIAKLKERVPAGFSIVIQEPFVVIGDGGAVAVGRYSTGTVKWAVDHLKADFFQKDPEEILDIWLFKDRESYNKYTKEIFNDTPGTPYGYFSHKHKALIMNIATGGGTLVHEIVHPFMYANFPECPPWFNEGLGSLFEQCDERDGHITGATNWRLGGLQKAIKAGSVPSFKALMAMNSSEFYNEDRGTNYAQARYLCYYLQERGLLVGFYKQFLANQKEDPSGFKTLKKVLAEEDMEAFKKKWEGFVMKLTFP
ncbi:MAG TPA: hypothetical protein VGQ99_18115 [Tepidisphaeraceae bacterium]|nr:hypothetical protein [Tepidisphaeraceae bacterium]